jgi:hypothetical protein
MSTTHVTSITPLEKRPCHPSYAKARGAAEAYEHVYIVRGFSDGHIHGPIIVQAPSGGVDRYFRPFQMQLSSDPIASIVTVLVEDPKNPWKSGMKIEDYAGDVQVFENAIPRAIFSGRDPVTKKPIWTRQLEITTVDPETNRPMQKIVVSKVVSWKVGASGTTGVSVPFCVKAVEMTAKEIGEHTKKKVMHARIPL